MQTWIPDFQIPLSGLNLQLSELAKQIQELCEKQEVHGTVWVIINPSKTYLTTTWWQNMDTQKTALQIQLKRNKTTITDPLQS